VIELWHVSEDPTIGVFHPQHNELHAIDEPLVWAVDTRYVWLYWFPRDCPRACFDPNEDTTNEDAERWLDGDRTLRVAPLELVELGDLLSRHAEARNELHIARSLYPLWDKVIKTTLDFSGIRLRNAVPP
jgi:hypothetical protein